MAAKRGVPVSWPIYRQPEGGERRPGMFDMPFTFFPNSDARIKTKGKRA